MSTAPTDPGRAETRSAAYFQRVSGAISTGRGARSDRDGAGVCVIADRLLEAQPSAAGRAGVAGDRGGRSALLATTHDEAGTELCGTQSRLRARAGCCCPNVAMVLDTWALL